jgi:L-lysine 2,3-aminomutase
VTAGTELRPVPTPTLRTYTGQRLRQLVLDRTGDAGLARDVEVVARVLPFKVNSYVADELIGWNRAPDDPMYRLLLPHRDMLDPGDFAEIEHVLGDPAALHERAANLRSRLNPHPSDQLTLNVPGEDGWGLQHKYRQTVLVFPHQGQTCHSYCGYCFRWAQFVDHGDMRMAVAGPDVMSRHLERHPEITDVLFTGGDPLVLRTEILRRYAEPLLQPEREHVRSVRFGTKAVSFWPHRIITGPDADELLRLLEQLVDAGKHVAMMLHVSHPRELSTPQAEAALRRLAGTGAVLRAQAPVVRHVNDDAPTWAQMWRGEVERGVVPYYMFVERDTGARRYFGLPLARAYEIYRDAQRMVSGLGRTARGPVMSASPGKVTLDGVVQLDRGPAFALRYLQARDPELVARPFHAVFDPLAEWFDELTPYAEADREFFPGRPSPGTHGTVSTDA